MQLFTDGKADAFLGFPPEPQELRARKIGRVIVNTATDKPWSQYYCCMLMTHREFVQKHPVATKRATRAILRPRTSVRERQNAPPRMIVDKGFAQNYDYALETLKEVRYDAWRTYNPEDTMRFHALRCTRSGMIKPVRSKLVAQGADWRFLNELRRELKAEKHVRIGPRICKGWDSGNYDENPKQCASNALSTFIPYCYTPGMVGPVHRHARGIHEMAQSVA